MKLIDYSRPLRLPALPHPTRNRSVYDRYWMKAWLLPIPRLSQAA